MSSTFIILCALLPLTKSADVSPTSETAESETFDTNSAVQWYEDYITCTKPSCKVICDTSAGCRKTIINASLSDTLQITCSETSSCQEMEVVVGGKISTKIECISDSACKDTDFTMSTSMNANVICDAPYSCQYATINAASTKQLYLSCNNNYSCNAVGVSCPYHEENTCKITCSAKDKTCYEMIIIVPQSYTYNYLDLLCPSNNKGDCSELNVDCRSFDTWIYGKSDATLIYNARINDYECEYSDTSYCCPYFKGTKLMCESGKDCTIDCSINGTKCDMVDGMEGNYLTVNCGASDCYYTSIYCPVGGCLINCIGTKSCYGASITYFGVLTDNGIIYINCKGIDACSETVIDAPYIDRIHITCNEACNNVAFNADYGNYVFINSSQSREYNIWNVQHAKTVIFTAIGGGHVDRLRHRLYADNAGSIQISLSSDSGRHETYNCYGHGCYWHIPHNTIINCYGTGCYFLGLIRDSDSNMDNITSGLQINVNDCGQCSNITECIGYFNIFCGPHTGDTFNRGCPNDDKCGCNHLMEKTKYLSDITDEHCYSTFALKTCKSGEECVINCDYTYGSCDTTVINGSLATYLTVNCMYNGYCNNALIYCPIGGCSVICKGSSVCSKTKINANTFYMDSELPESGNISIYCQGSDSCNHMEINANYADVVNIECDNINDNYNDNDNYVCSSITLNAHFANQVNLNFLGNNASYDGTWNIQNAAEVTVYSVGQNAVYSNNFHAEFVDSAEFVCSSRYESSCCFNHYYIPYNTTFNCYGHGCGSFMGWLYLTTNSSGLSINVYGCTECRSFSDCINSVYLFTELKKKGTSYSHNTRCYSTGDNIDYETGCNDLIDERMRYLVASDDYMCPIDQSIITGNITQRVLDTECGSGFNCTIYCANCSSMLINGSISHYLTVICDDCKYSTVICPIGGCYIKCKYQSACEYTNVVYNGAIEDGAHVKVDCIAQNACHYTEITANNANVVTLNCFYSGWASWDLQICLYLTLSANYAGLVNIFGDNGFDSSNLYVENAKSVVIVASGSYGFQSNYLYAMNAGLVKVECMSFGVHSVDSPTCRDAHWYLPSNTTFNCYGVGCRNMHAFYIQDTLSSISLNIYSCSECNDTFECLGTLTFQCGAGYISKQSYDGYANCTDYNINENNIDCGCADFINGISFKQADDLCLSAKSSHFSKHGVIVFVVGIVVIVIILVLVFAYRSFKNRRSRMQNVALMIEGNDIEEHDIEGNDIEGNDIEGDSKGNANSVELVT